MIFYDNDICLMITGASFEMTSPEFVSSLTLGENEDCTQGLECNLSGWGNEEVSLNRDQNDINSFDILSGPLN